MCEVTPQNKDIHQLITPPKAQAVIKFYPTSYKTSQEN